MPLPESCQSLINTISQLGSEDDQIQYLISFLDSNQAKDSLQVLQFFQALQDFLTFCLEKNQTQSLAAYQVINLVLNRYKTPFDRWVNKNEPLARLLLEVLKRIEVPAYQVINIAAADTQPAFSLSSNAQPA